MLAFGNARGGATAGLALLALLIGGLHACTTAPTSPPPTRQVAVVSDVAVERDGDATVVKLRGLSHPVFTAFRGEDPERVVVDLTAVRPERLAESLAIYDGLVEEVSVAEFSAGSQPSTRVEISLAADADFDVIPLDDRLEIRVRPIGESTAEAWEDEEADPAWGEQEEGASTAAQEAAPATTLTAISSETFGSGVMVRLHADGRISNVEAFTLDDPARLVVDVPGVTSAVEAPNLAVGAPRVSRIRVGAHADKVRIVVDGGEESEPFATRNAASLADGYVIAVGDDASLTAALEQVGAKSVVARAAPEEASAEPWESVPAALDTTSDETVEAVEPTTDPVDPIWAEPMGEATETVAEATEAVVEDTEAVVEESEMVVEATEAASEETVTVAEASEAAAPEAPAVEPAAEEAATHARVYGVQYEPAESRDRVVVVTDRPIEHQVLRPDPGTLVVSVPNAAIDEAAAVRIAPDPGGPVSLVTAFAQPDVETPEVRVVVKRAPGLVPTVTQQGTMLVLDFPRQAAMAEPPPVVASKAVRAAVEEAAPTSAPKDEAKMAAMTPPASVAPAAPAALSPSEPTEILQEGGLLDGKEYVGRRISLDFKDVDIQDVLRLIADVSDLNIIAGDEVSGQVTIRLVDVPWDQALDVILLTKGLGFVRVGNVLRIAPSDVLQSEEEARLQERRSKERLEDLVVKLQPVNYADVKEVSTMVKRLLSPRGSVDTDQRTNTVIIKDIPSVIDESTALIKAIDTQTPQVMIEAKVVEANLDFSREIGSEWGIGAQPRDEDLGSDFVVGQRRPVTVQDDKFPFEQDNNVVVANPISSLANGILNLGAFILDDRMDVSLSLRAAEANGEGKVISSPRVVTLDNREAVIEQGVSIPFQTFENGDAQLEFIDAVLSLKVTPHITADRSIIMKIEVSRNAPDDSVQTPTGSPAIAKNQAKTETLVKDGQTLVIGGIYVVDKAETSSRVPYFHKIPGLGWAFKNQTLRDVRKELLIFVTPRVVVGPELAS